MKVVILAGGYGTRIGEETVNRPKPMIEIGGKPILWHIMKLYSYYGFNEFIICAGYKQNVIKEYFANYFLYNSDVTFDFTKENKLIIHNNKVENWKVTIVDTGIDTLTGGRVKRIKDYIDGDDFFLTYGDGVSDVNIKKLYEYHKKSNKKLTLTTVQPGNRFGSVIFDENGEIERFSEKKIEDGGWINGGFMVASKEIFEHISDDSTILEKEPFEYFSENNEMGAFKHKGFWQCMDTLRDKTMLENMINEKKAPWMIWEN